MSNALEQAKRAQAETANGTKVTIPLSLLESLIAEIERLSRIDNVRDIARKHVYEESMKP